MGVGKGWGVGGGGGVGGDWTRENKENSFWGKDSFVGRKWNRVTGGQFFPKLKRLSLGHPLIFQLILLCYCAFNFYHAYFMTLYTFSYGYRTNCSFNTRAFN